jgi:hypothetical protein
MAEALERMSFTPGTAVVVVPSSGAWRRISDAMGSRSSRSSVELRRSWLVFAALITNTSVRPYRDGVLPYAASLLLDPAKPLPGAYSASDGPA